MEFGRYTVTVYIADRGAPIINEKGQRDTSGVGHMWYSLDDNQSGLVQAYGFHPSIDKVPFTPLGKVKTNDNDTYMVSSQPVYKKTFTITEEEYNKLSSLSEIAKNHKTFGPYEASSNACVDFTWDILSNIGIGKSLLLDDGTLMVNPKRDGYIWPSDNKFLVDASWNFREKYVVPIQYDKQAEDMVSRKQELPINVIDVERMTPELGVGNDIPKPTATSEAATTNSVAPQFSVADTLYDFSGKPIMPGWLDSMYKADSMYQAMDTMFKTTWPWEAASGGTDNVIIQIGDRTYKADVVTYE